jgi:hypothetical protein
MIPRLLQIDANEQDSASFAIIGHYRCLSEFIRIDTSAVKLEFWICFEHVDKSLPGVPPC